MGWEKHLPGGEYALEYGVTETMSEYREKLKQLRAESSRYRLALERIAGNEVEFDEGSFAKEIAKEALEGNKELGPYP